MNLAWLAAMSAGGVMLLWSAQSVALASIGEPLAWPLRTRTDHVRVKWTRRIGVQGIWALLLLGFPWAIGSDPAAFFARLFPPPQWIVLGRTLAACLLCMWAALACEMAAGWLVWQPQHSTAARRAKLLRRFLTPVPLAIMEEAVFRGTILEQIAAALPEGRIGATIAVVASAALFSAVHFIRPDEQRPFWQPALGLFLFGLLCGAAYVGNGHTLWMPVTIHAAGIFVTETTRLYTTFRGPPLLIGYSCFPHCGLVGMATLGALAVVLAGLW